MKVTPSLARKTYLNSVSLQSYFDCHERSLLIILLYSKGRGIPKSADAIFNCLENFPVNNDKKQNFKGISIVSATAHRNTEAKF